MARLAKALFLASDIAAWLLILLSVVCAGLSPIALIAYAKMAHQPVSYLFITWYCALWIAIAFGAYALTRRKLIGLAPIIVFAVIAAANGNFTFALLVVGGSILLFCSPFLALLAISRKAD